MKDGKENLIQKMFVLDLHKPVHKRVNDFVKPLERGLQGALVISLLADFFEKNKQEGQEDPNRSVKNYLFSKES